ncbi:MAG TPA: Hsp20/alpha crystallin family protein [Actinomycetota bacterium]|nr:Hsp20/alpha crystallin family protein [Actinomycetota bacterium]
MRLGTLTSPRNEWDEVFDRFFGNTQPWMTGGYNVPTDVFHTEDSMVIRMDLPGVSPDDVEVSVQENTLLINGSRKFAWDADKVRFVRRGTFYGDFTQRVSLGKGLKVDSITATYDNGVLELRIPYAEEVQPRKVDIQIGSGQKALQS